MCFLLFLTSPSLPLCFPGPAHFQPLKSSPVSSQQVEGCRKISSSTSQYSALHSSARDSFSWESRAWQILLYRQCLHFFFSSCSDVGTAEAFLGCCFFGGYFQAISLDLSSLAVVSLSFTCSHFLGSYFLGGYILGYFLTTVSLTISFNFLHCYFLAFISSDVVSLLLFQMEVA